MGLQCVQTKRARSDAIAGKSDDSRADERLAVIK
jgi:hypothetical protein